MVPDLTNIYFHGRLCNATIVCFADFLDLKFLLQQYLLVGRMVGKLGDICGLW